MDLGAVLIIDDDERAIRDIRRRLKWRGYQVDVATTPERGLEKALQLEPDLIILDIRLPDEPRGFEVIDALQNDLRTRRIPILVFSVTADENPEYRARGLDSGATWYLPRSTSMRLLETYVRRALEFTSQQRLDRSERERVERESAPFYYDVSAGQIWCDGQAIACKPPLTAQERLLLERLWRDRNQICTYRAIAAHIYNKPPDEVVFTTQQISAMVARLRAKLPENVIETVRGDGYMLATPEVG